MPDTRTLTLEVTVPADAYDTMVGALCRAGGFDETSDANARSTVLTWARRTVQNVLAADAERVAAKVIDKAKAETDAVLDAIGDLSAAQLEGVTPNVDPAAEPIIEETQPE